MNFNQLCEKEVLDFHSALELWLGGHSSQDDQSYRRIADVLTQEFTYVPPEGEFVLRSQSVMALKQAYGAEGEAFKIKIENMRTVISSTDLCMVVYEEWQKLPDKTTARQSTAVFQRKAGAPNDVEWVHVHETWLPQEKVVAYASQHWV